MDLREHVLLRAAAPAAAPDAGGGSGSGGYLQGATAQRVGWRRLRGEEGRRIDANLLRGGCSLINNAMGLLPLLATAYITGDGEFEEAPNQLALLSSQELIFMGISCVVAVPRTEAGCFDGPEGAAISYANIWCQSLISATSMLILVNLTRFLVILLDATLLHTDRLSTLQLLGALITVLGGALRFTNAAAVTVTVTFGAVHPVTSTVSSYMAVRPKRGGGDGRYGRVCTDGH
ncbi:GDP-mannose transporter GONST4 [Durusdinium trenchii]|uniref:GDP-mannose transporter GONST4 n=1 Tax=Durusdinium trenchii TaxID=1381693 RepID=A0ABP0PXP2_9DINO